MKALLNEEGKKIWGYVFPNGTVPVKSVQPFEAKIKGKGKGTMSVFLVDWAALTETERGLILDHLKGRFGDSREGVEAEVLKNGLPLRSVLVSCVSIPGRFF
jgi:hypothetical protein